MDEIVGILEKTISPRQEDQKEAVAYFDAFIKRDLGGFLQKLSDVLYNQSLPPYVRAAAGLQLKNQLTAKDEVLKQTQQDKWISLPTEMKDYVKQRVFAALSTELYKPLTAPQCVANIAIIELPLKMWPGLVDALVQNITNPANADHVKQSTLETIGYICQDIEQSCLEPNESNIILTAIVNGMQNANREVKLAATTALLNSLEFTEAIFQNELERNYIMEVVCQATQCEDIPVCVAALQCTVKIMSLYYQFMEAYISVLFSITMSAMKSENDDLALQGIEFWSNVCDEELQLANEAQDAQEQGRQPTQRSKHYARQALEQLVPVLIDMLARQEENDDSEDWKPCKSAGVCLMLLANCCENTIVGHVLPYIKQNITSDDWKRRDAAVMTFGSILDGPDQMTLQPIAEQIVPYLINFMKDPSNVVRDSAAWAIGKLCDTVPGAVLSQNYLTVLIQALIENLSNEPRVASNVCWALNSLVGAAGEISREACGPREYPPSFVLSPFYLQIFEQLIKTTDRPDNAKDQDHNLRNAAYEALMTAIKAAPMDCYQIVYPSTFQMVVPRIQFLLNHLREVRPNNPEQKSQLYDMVSLLWTTVQALVKRMEREHAKQESDIIMQNLLLTMKVCADSCAVLEDTLMAVSIILESIEKHFSRYMSLLKPELVGCINNPNSDQLNITAIGLLSDLSRGIPQEDMLAISDEFMNLLYGKLSDQDYDKLAKAQILSIFGDFALALGLHFQKWVPTCLDMLHRACQVTVQDRNDYEMIDYCVQLREYAIEGYTGIIHGLKDEKDQRPQEVNELMLASMPNIIEFLTRLSSDPDLTDNLLNQSCGLVGDIAENFSKFKLVIELLQTPPIALLLNNGKNSKVERTKTIAKWAYSQAFKV